MSGRRKSRSSSQYGRRSRRSKPDLRAGLVFPTHVLFNGNIITMNKNQPSAEALAIHDEKIVAVGSNKEVLSIVSPQTKITDLKGATVLPGFIDCHIHLIEYGLSLGGIDCRRVRSINELKRLVAGRTTGTGEWILGRGWDQEKFEENRYPTRADLDQVSPLNPVILTRVCGHICVANSAALREAGVDRNTPNPEGGLIDRDSDGEPTGILRENAVDLVNRVVPTPGLEAYVKATTEACQMALQAGLTTVHCIVTSDMELQALSKLHLERRLQLRFYVFIPASQLAGATTLGLRSGFGDDMLRIGGVKIFTDGSLGARTAALEEPYSDDPTTRGVAIYTQEQLNDVVAEAHLAGFQTAIHAIGDRAIGMALDAIEEARRRFPTKNLRHRIEHASVLTEDLIRRMKKLNVLAVVQPHFIVSDYWVHERLGHKRSELAYPFQSLVRSGVSVVGSSDCPVEPLSPLSGITAAINRPGSKEALSLEQAIELYTRSAAYASYEENWKGTIEPGKLADLVVLEKDPGKVPPEMIQEIKVLATIVGGRTQYAMNRRSSLYEET